MPLDPTLLARLIEEQSAALEMWAAARCAAGEDVVQEAFCRLACQETPPDHPVAWLYRVCRNLAEKQRLSDARRLRREHHRASAQVNPPATSDPLEIAETVAAVQALPQELREVLVARVWGQLSLDEVAQLCGVSTATAWRRYQSALETLRSKFTSPCEP